MVASILKTSLNCVESWNKANDAGKSIIQQILDAQKAKTESGYSIEIQNLCDKLSEKLEQQNDVLEVLSDLVDRAQSLHDLSNLSISQNESSLANESISSDTTLGNLSHHLKIIERKYREQYEVSKTVSEKIGSEKNIDNAVFLACLWNFQPRLHDEYFVSVEYLKTHHG